MCVLTGPEVTTMGKAALASEDSSLVPASCPEWRNGIRAWRAGEIGSSLADHQETLLFSCAFLKNQDQRAVILAFNSTTKYYKLT